MKINMTAWYIWLTCSLFLLCYQDPRCLTTDQNIWYYLTCWDHCYVYLFKHRVRGSLSSYLTLSIECRCFLLFSSGVRIGEKEWTILQLWISYCIRPFFFVIANLQIWGSFDKYLFKKEKSLFPIYRANSENTKFG